VKSKAMSVKSIASPAAANMPPSPSIENSSIVIVPMKSSPSRPVISIRFTIGMDISIASPPVKGLFIVIDVLVIVS